MPAPHPSRTILIAFISVLVAVPQPARAESSGAKAMLGSDEYVLRTWEIENGLPTNTVTSIAQTPDGYLWLATPTGLVRFDGARFSSFVKEATPGLELGSQPY